MAVKVGMVSLGCPKNQVDAELMLSLLREEGFELTSDAGLAEVVIVNTCGFIEDAKKESIENILEFCTLKQEGRIQCVVVTGCLAERYREEVANEIPEADVILGIGANAEIVDAVKRALAGEKLCYFPEKDKLPLSGARVLTTLPFYAYLKIAEGCDNRCTYCAIPMIRGRFRSRPMEEIVKEAEGLAAGGVKELVVVAQDTTRYGEDLYGALMLPELLRRLCRIDGFAWIRVLYCYPERITDALLDVMASEEKIAKYIDIPLQHANEQVLRRMNRSGDARSLVALMHKIRRRVPGITLRTTLIAGFPGETKEQFAELASFVKEVEFDRLGCFAYSVEEGTPAAALPGQLSEGEKKRRAEIIMDGQYDIMRRKNEALVGRAMTVLVEGYDKYAACWFGRSEADAPDIDGKVFIRSEKPLSPGRFVQVYVDEVLDLDLLATVL